MSELSELQSIKSKVEDTISTVSQLKTELFNLRDKPRLIPLRSYFLNADANLDSVDDYLREAGNELMKIEDEMYKLKETLAPGVYGSYYGNAISWDGQVAYDLDMGENVEFGVIMKDKYIRPLD